MSLKQKVITWFIALLAIVGWVLYMPNSTEAKAPEYDTNFSSLLNNYVIKKEWVGKGNSLGANIKKLFYPNGEGGDSLMYIVIRDMTLWVMILFFVRAWASLLLNKKPEESRKHLYSLLYIILGWVLVYASSWLFWTIFNFWNMWDDFTKQIGDSGIEWVTNSLTQKVAFVILSAIKAAAFFVAIIMTVVTWFKVIAAGEWEKWKKLVKWLINVVVALLVIKWVDFVYYLAADSNNFVEKASVFIINIAKVFGWIYGIITVIMVIVAWYLYITDGWTWSNFKKASNVLINILLSALVLFGFLLIVYQIFAEFQEKGDALKPAVALINLTKFYV
jgi:hypothetical protein